MIRISCIMIALMLQVGVILAATAAGDSKTEPITGMEFVRVPQGCFQPGNLHGMTAAASTASKKNSASATRTAAVDSSQIREVDALADSVAGQPVFIDQAVGGQNQPYGAVGSAAQVGWYMGNSGNTTHPVGKKRANALGLYDMSGNVWEWTADCWNETLANMPKDGSANKSGHCAARVLRGGSWYDAKALIKTTSRLWNDTDKRDNNSGFRLVFD